VATTWRDRARHLRRLWRMPIALQGDIGSMSSHLVALRQELATTRSDLAFLLNETGRLQAGLEALSGQQEQMRAAARLDAFKILEGAAAATQQLLQPRLDALERKVEEAAQAGSPEALQPMVASTVETVMQPLHTEITSAFGRLQQEVVSAVEALVQPRHADLRDLIMTATYRAEEAGALGRKLVDTIVDLRLKIEARGEGAELHLLRLEDLGFDLLALYQARSGFLVGVPRLTLRTDHPIADASTDHLHPRGAANDDTRHPQFVNACERHFGSASLRHLDLGCAGAGLVWDFLLAGHASYGIEGSDYPLRTRRAYWKVIPERLFTADVTRPFDLLDGTGERLQFDVITAWEVLEHIPETLVDGLFGNIVRHLGASGVFVASVATFPDEDEATGAIWHVTIRQRDWWLKCAARHGLYPVETHVFVPADFPRGSGNPRAHDWDASLNPELGFHLVLGRSSMQDNRCLAPTLRPS